MSDCFDPSFSLQLSSDERNEFSAVSWQIMLSEIEAKSGGLDDQKRIAVQQDIINAKREYDRNWRGFFNQEAEKLWQSAKHIDQALAEMIFNSADYELCDAWSVDTVEDMFMYIQNNLDDFIGDRALYSHTWGRTIDFILIARKQIEVDIENLDTADKANDRFRESPIIDTPARLKQNLQQLISDLCEVWHNEFDTLGLPPKGNEKPNPLLRFIEAALDAIIKGEKPARKTVANFVRSHIRGH